MAQPELIKDIEARVKKSGDTMTGNLSGKYFQGTWLQTTAITDLGSSPSQIAVISGGWIYYRTPAELAKDIGLTGNYVLKSGDTMTGNLTAPTFIGSLQGNASSADKLNTNAGGLKQPIYFKGGKPVVAADDYVFYDEVSGAPSDDSSSPFVLKIGDTMTGNLTAPNFIGNLIGNANTATSANTANTATSANTANTANTATNATNATNVNIANDTSSKLYVLGAITTGNTRIYRESSVYMSSNVLYGAAWNDYAEYRQSDITHPGRCIIENGDDTLSLSIERLQRGAEIVSDTFGFAIGETDDCKTPIAASGRVLAYPFEDREEFKSHIGYPVCSGPNGTVSIMTDEEEQLYPSRIIGYVSAVPDYETWGTGNVKVNGRIWIRIK